MPCHDRLRRKGEQHFEIQVKTTFSCTEKLKVTDVINDHQNEYGGHDHDSGVVINIQ